MYTARHATRPVRSHTGRLVFAAASITALGLGATAPIAATTLAESGQGHCASATTQNSDCASHGHGLADPAPPTNGGNGAGSSGQCTGNPDSRPAVCPAT
jgi:hypothetical protein